MQGRSGYPNLPEVTERHTGATTVRVRGGEESHEAALGRWCAVSYLWAFSKLLKCPCGSTRLLEPTPRCEQVQDVQSRPFRLAEAALGQGFYTTLLLCSHIGTSGQANCWEKSLTCQSPTRRSQMGKNHQGRGMLISWGGVRSAWGCSSVVECLTSMCEVLGSIPAPGENTHLCQAW